MWAGEKLGRQRIELRQVTFLDSILVGLAQAIAIVPGVSRSGITMSAAMFRGMTRETAARFSFLLSTPIIGGAALKEGWNVLQDGITPEMVLPFLAGVVVAAIVGYAVIAFLIRYLERGTFRIFVVYRLALGVLVLALGWGLRHV
jgi:undecaprenyl-diphosphatase